MTRRILVAPAGRRFSPNGGSEDRVVYDIVVTMAAREPDFQFTCMAELADGEFPQGVVPVAVGPRRTEELGGFVLPFRIARAAKTISPVESVDLVHHALPFSVGRSFSLLASQARRIGLPVVLGPVQTPLEWTGADERGGRLEEGRPSPGLLRAAQAGATLTWPLTRKLLSSLSARTLRQANRVVVYVPAAQALLESVGVDPKRMEVIPPPTWVSSTAPKCPPDLLGPCRLVTAGYLIARKGVRDIVTAVAELVADGLDIVLDIAGDGPAAPALKDLVRHDGLSNVVHFHGWLDRPRLAELLRTSHAYVSMSRGESWGQAVAEGLMSGLVVISAANVGASSMRRLGAPVRLVRLGDVRQLSHELRQLCHTDRQTLARQGEEGAIWAARHISRTAVAERWADVYREAIEESRALNTAQSS